MTEVHLLKAALIPEVLSVARPLIQTFHLILAAARYMKRGRKMPFAIFLPALCIHFEDEL